ncbi:MAG TPA: response regulator [Myxococcaceae bacterium]|nr:response regulator [Myxococcaceae bacterium]
MELRNLTVLVVDDSQTTATAASQLLSAEGLHIITARDGAEALGQVASHEVALVLLDIELPGLDGLQILKMLRSAQGRRYLPVVMMSVSESREKRTAAFRLGADDFIAKPWDSEELWLRVKRCLSLRLRFDEQLEAVSKLERFSAVDPVTQAYNHRFLSDRLKEEFRRAQRYDDALALVRVDVGLRTPVGGAPSQAATDGVMKDVAERLRRAVRETDLVARWAESQFTLLLPKTPLAGALTLAERLLSDLRGARLGAAQGLQFTPSVGVATFPHRSIITSESLLRSLEEAAEQARHEGGEKVGVPRYVGPGYAPPS